MPDKPPEKVCASCHESKPLEAYTASKRKRDGRVEVCKACLAKRRRDKRHDDRARGIGPPPGKKALARKRSVISLDERRPGGRAPESRTGKNQPQDARFAGQPSRYIPERPGRERDTSWYELFLHVYVATRAITDACREVGIHPSTFYDARAADPNLAAGWAYARECVKDQVVKRAFALGVDGVEEVIYGMVGGSVHGSMAEVGRKTVWNTTTLRKLLDGEEPLYRANPAVGVAVQVNTQVNNRPSDDPKVVDAGVAFLARLAESRGG